MNILRLFCLSILDTLRQVASLCSEVVLFAKMHPEFQVCQFMNQNGPYECFESYVNKKILSGGTMAIVIGFACFLKYLLDC